MAGPLSRKAGTPARVLKLIGPPVATLAATVVFRGALFHSLPTPPQPFDYLVPNLLTSTLGAAPPVSPGMPPQPLDLEAPQANNWRPVEPTLNLLETTLQPTAASPFIPVDISGPAPVIPVPAWNPQRNLLLTAVPFRPNIQASLDVRTLFSFDPPNLLTSTLAPVTQAAPFAPVLSEALPRALGVPAYDPVDALTGVLLGQTIPFHQLDWPGLQSSRLPSDSPFGENLALLTTPQRQPFNQLDWPALPKLISPEPHLIPNTTIRQVAAPAPPNLHKLYYDVSSGRLFWQVSKTANPIEIVPL